jgi:glucan 1,3-beta-glucosidase
MTDVSPSLLLSGIHWPTAQATSLQNIVFQMSTASGNQQEGIFIESGSGGLVADLTFFGGMNGMSVGNQYVWRPASDPDIDVVLGNSLCAT